MSRGVNRSQEESRGKAGQTKSREVLLKGVNMEFGGWEPIRVQRS